MVRSPAQSNGCREVLTRYQQAGVARQAMLHGKAETKGLLGFSRDPRLQVSGPPLDRFVCPNIRSSARTTSPTWPIAITIGSTIYGGRAPTIVATLIIGTLGGFRSFKGYVRRA